MKIRGRGWGCVASAIWLCRSATVICCHGVVLNKVLKFQKRNQFVISCNIMLHTVLIMSDLHMFTTLVWYHTFHLLFFAFTVSHERKSIQAVKFATFCYMESNLLRRDLPWPWNPGQTSTDVQNRGVKKDLCPPKTLKKIKRRNHPNMMRTACRPYPVVSKVPGSRSGGGDWVQTPLTSHEQEDGY